MVEKYNVLFLISLAEHSIADIKNLLKESGISASYNTGAIPKSLARTFAPCGGMVFPISMQDNIWDPLELGDYSDFDISAYWNKRDRKEIEKEGASEHLIAACWVTLADITRLDRYYKGEEIYVWHWNQWVAISKIHTMKWGPQW